MIIALIAVVGCASPRAPTYVLLPPPPSEEVRAQLGAITVITTNQPATANFTQPMGKGRAAGHGGWVGFWSAPAYGAAVGEGYGAVAGLFLSPVTGTAGAIYGVVAGMSQKEYAQVCDTLQKTLKETDLPVRMRAAVATELAPLTPQSGNLLATLEIIPKRIGLVGPQDIEPPLIFECVVQARVRRTADQTELFVAEFSYTGSQHTLREWAAQDGAAFRDELAKTCAWLPALIVEQVFLVYPLPDSPAQQRVLPWPPSKPR